MGWRLAGFLAVVLLFNVLGSPTRAEIDGFAMIEDDGSLIIAGKRVQLHGIYIPETNRICRDSIRPIRCATRAVQALEFKVRGFVHCDEVSFNADGSLNAFCYVDRSPFDGGEDIGAYLIKRGWAVAGPEAPFEYGVFEEIARENRRGVWGFNADAFR